MHSALVSILLLHHFNPPSPGTPKLVECCFVPVPAPAAPLAGHAGALGAAVVAIAAAGSALSPELCSMVLGCALRVSSPASADLRQAVTAQRQVWRVIAGGWWAQLMGFQPNICDPCCKYEKPALAMQTRVSGRFCLSF